MKNAALRALAEDYGERIQRFCPLEMVEIKDGRATDSARRLREEGMALREILSKKKGKGNPMAVIWDERGKPLNTQALATFLDQEISRGHGVDLILGSSHGLEAALKEEIPRHFQLSSFTLTHEWARALTLEQIYRAFCLLRGFPYHH